MLNIERAGVKDHGVVTSLLLYFTEDGSWQPEVDRDRWDRVLAELLDSDRWLFLLARVDDEPVGLAVVNFFLSIYGSREQGRLAAIVVNEESRRKGIGGRLMEAVLAAARRRGCREIEVRVDSPDDEVAAFYRGLDPDRERLLLTWRLNE